MRFIVVIPARLASTRLPRKPLADIAGKPMVVRVAERARASGAAAVWVAADDATVVSACVSHGIQVLSTRADHPSGTDRLAEVVDTLGLADDAIVVNVQGDEPLLPASAIDRVAHALGDAPAAAIATLAHPIRDAAEFFNPNVVKVVCDAGGMAIYFSRAPIPYARDAFAASRDRLPDQLGALRHVGLYAYRAGFLRAYRRLAPAPLERMEALEQLRALWYGHPIVVAIAADAPPAGVDTPEDLDRVRAAYATGMGTGGVDAGPNDTGEGPSEGSNESGGDGGGGGGD